MQIFPDCEESSIRIAALMVRALLCTSLLLMACILQSCGSQPGPMTGTWFLSLISNGSLEQTVASLNLHQSGDTLSGTITSTLCTSSTNVTGSISNGLLTLQIAQSNITGSLTGSVNNNFTSASGQYEISGDWCAQSSSPGTWSAAFVSS
jgi:hypothetical protein